MNERFKIRAAVFVILESNGQVLLSLRQHTGYHDGEYGLIQGHLEAGEEIAAAAIREAKEEAGITILPQDLCFKAVCHDQTELPYIQFIFTCQRWSGEITNTEPEYCQELKWFETDKLPPNIISKIKTFIKLPENIKLFEI